MATVSLGMSLYYGLNRTWYLYYGTGKEPQVSVVTNSKIRPK